VVIKRMKLALVAVGTIQRHQSRNGLHSGRRRQCARLVTQMQNPQARIKGACSFSDLPVDVIQQRAKAAFLTGFALTEGIASFCHGEKISNSGWARA